MDASIIKHSKNRIFHQVILAFLILCFSISANAQELDDNIKGILKQLKLEEGSVYAPLVVKKTLPYAKNQTVIVIPKIAEEDTEYATFVFDAYIVIAKNGKIISKFYEPKSWTSDAVQLYGITIDTAPYILNDDTRAFGVRLNSGHAGASVSSFTEISLFIPQKSSLTRVLNNYPISSYTGERPAFCEREAVSSESVISIGEEKTNGFANLIIKQKRTWTVGQATDANEHGCEEKEASMNLSKTLKFDGQEYKYK